MRDIFISLYTDSICEPTSHIGQAGTKKSDANRWLTGENFTFGVKKTTIKRLNYTNLIKTSKSVRKN